MINIISYNREGLSKLAIGEDIWKNKVLPITKHRALAHINNPFADNDDILLLVAYDKERIVAYMGVFMDRIILEDNKNNIAWLSTWWADPNYKSTGIGRELLHKMYSAHNGKIGISQFTPSAKRVYDRSGYFYTLKGMNGIKAVLNPQVADLIQVFYPKLKKVKTVIFFAEVIIKTIINIKIHLLKQWFKSSHKINYYYIDEIDEETENFIKKIQYDKINLSIRNKEYFKWMKLYPWVVESDNEDEYHNYFFSSVARRFEISFIKILNDQNEITGFLVVQIRNNTLKVLYAFYLEQDLNDIYSVLIEHTFKNKVEVIITYEKNLVKKLEQQKLLFLYKKKKVKEAIISKSFGNIDYKKYYFHFGDGDCSFA